MKPTDYLKNGRVDFNRFFEKNPNEQSDAEAEDDARELVRQQREDRSLWKEKEDNK